MQVSSPGRATLARGWLKRGEGEGFCTQKLSPLIQKMKGTGFMSCAALRSPIFCVFDSILRYYSSPTLSYFHFSLFMQDPKNDSNTRYVVLLCILYLFLCFTLEHTPYTHVENLIILYT